MLEAQEISDCLSRVHLVADAQMVKEWMEKTDKDSDGKLDFEEFMKVKAGVGELDVELSRSAPLLAHHRTSPIQSRDPRRSQGAGVAAGH